MSARIQITFAPDAFASGAPQRPLPPCGGGLGWGVLQAGNSRLPPPLTPPHKGEGNRAVGSEKLLLEGPWDCSGWPLAAFAVADAVTLAKPIVNRCAEHLAAVASINHDRSETHDFAVHLTKSRSH